MYLLVVARLSAKLIMNRMHAQQYCYFWLDSPTCGFIKFSCTIIGRLAIKQQQIDKKLKRMLQREKVLYNWAVSEIIINARKLIFSADRLEHNCYVRDTFEHLHGYICIIGIHRTFLAFTLLQIEIFTPDNKRIILSIRFSYSCSHPFATL